MVVVALAARAGVAVALPAEAAVEQRGLWAVETGL